jgi:predicted Zn-dependent peptidase
MEGQAQNLGGNWLAANDLNFSERYLAAVKRCHPRDVQRVARQYLTPENRTLYALLPERRVAETPRPKLKRTATSPSKNLNCPTACACW